MKLTKLSALWVLFFLSCDVKSFSYKIEGFVKVKSKNYPAVWYVNEFTVHDDTVTYFNSDNTRVDIVPPYIIKKLK